jgi:hypothetical protein
VTETPPLDYAQTPSLTRRKAFRRAMIAAGVLAIIICGWAMLPQYWRNAQQWRQHRRWMSYTCPPSVIAFEPPGEKAKRLFQPRSDYIMRPSGVFHFVAGLPPAELFVHGRRRPDGARRLVLAALGYDRTNAGIQLRLEGEVIIPATIARASRRSPISFGPLIADSTGKTPRIYAGQPDLNDASHFTMQFEFPDGRTGTIHGRLSDDDSIDFQFESGPSQPQPSPTTAENG